MTKRKLRYGMRTVLVVVTLAALATAWYLPFEPNTTFSPAILVKQNKKEDASTYDKYKTTITNNSRGSIWCRVYNETVLAVSCSSGSENIRFDMPSVKTFVRLKQGESIEVDFTPDSDWDEFQVGVQVFDWRNREFSCTSETMSSNKANHAE